MMEGVRDEGNKEKESWLGCCEDGLTLFLLTTSDKT
jgi:hypothetical protein